MSPAVGDGPELPAGFDATDVDPLLVGAVDLHTHPGPSPLPRRMGIRAAAIDAAAAGYRAIAVKSHHHSMTTDVAALTDEGGLAQIPVEVLSGIALNVYVGGINPYAVELCLALGGRIVWFPTYSAHAHHLHDEGHPVTGPLRRAPEVAVLDEDGAVRPEVHEVLERCAEAGAIVTGGHLAAEVIDVVFAAARAHRVERFVVNHPQYVVGASPDKVAEWARHGALIEHSVGMYHDSGGHKRQRWPLDDLLAYVAAAGVAHTALVSDTGQAGNLRPVDTIRLAVAHLLAAGVAESDLVAMTGENAAALLAR